MILGIEASRANKAHKTGTERYAHDLLRAIAAVDHVTPFRLYTKDPLAGSLATLGENFEECILAWPPQRLWTQIRLSLEMAAHPPDVLFVPAHTLPLLHPRATVTTVHDLGFDRSPDLYARKELLYQRWALRFALKHAHSIITPSAFTKNEILSLYPKADEKKIHVIHHGFDSTPFTKALPDHPEQVLARHGIRAPYIFYVGRLQVKKNTPNLIRAFALMREQRPDLRAVQLVLAGQPDFGFQGIQEQIRELKLGESVRMPGYVDEKDIVVLMRRAQVFAFPSRYEGFGFPVLEAQAAGVPVLASTAASLPEVGGEGGALYADPDDIDSMATSLERLLSDTELRKQLCEQGKKNIERFQWEQCALQTLFVVKSAHSA